MMRSPRFEFPSVRDALAFCAWAEDYFTDISDIVRQHSRFARLTSLTPRIIGNAVHLTFTYHTADAAGQNMTTTCTWQACRWILAHLPLALTPQRYILESNLSSDKKSSWSSFAQGRGTQVIAEATLTAAACRSRLRIEPAQLVGAFQGFCEGSVAAGMTGVNINTANVIAAMFTALGQDIACSHESSLSQLQMRLTPEGNVYCSMTLPALVIGTVGGGTTLPDQAECLQMLGCQGANGSERLAEIIASFCLALDISTLSALASDEFAKSHERLGRQRRTAPPGRRGGDPLHRCFQHARYTAAWGEQPPAHIAPMRWQGNQDSILTALSSHSATLPVGLFAYRLQREDGTQVAALLKHKPPTDAITQLLHSLAAGCTPELAELLARLLPASEFSHAREREMALITQSIPPLPAMCRRSTAPTKRDNRASSLRNCSGKKCCLTASPAACAGSSRRSMPRCGASPISMRSGIAAMMTCKPPFAISISPRSTPSTAWCRCGRPSPLQPSHCATAFHHIAAASLAGLRRKQRGAVARAGDAAENAGA